MLTATSGSWTPADASVTLQWLRGDTVVGTGSSYTTATQDVGSELRVRATATKSGWTGGVAESTGFGPITSAAPVLVAPVVDKGATERKVYLPEGQWYDFWTNERHNGGQEITRQVDLATLPLLVRAGAILPLDPVRQYTGEPTDEPTTIRIYPGSDGEFRLYDDDGATLEYQNGQFARTRFTWNDGEKRLTIDPDTSAGNLEPAARTFSVKSRPVTEQSSLSPARKRFSRGAWKLSVQAMCSFSGREAQCRAKAASARLKRASCSGV